MQEKCLLSALHHWSPSTSFCT